MFKNRRLGPKIIALLTKKKNNNKVRDFSKGVVTKQNTLQN